MNIGFTGTRAGLTDPQSAALAELFAQIDGVGGVPITFHHGCCIGGDATAAALARRAPNWRLVAHPPENPYLQDHGALAQSHEHRPPAEYLARDRAIVQACDLLIACPKGPEERRGSGTWFTIREARRHGKRVLIVWPDGAVTSS